MKGAPIKPGTVCMIVGITHDVMKQNNGAMVTAVAIHPTATSFYGNTHWEIKDPSRPVFDEYGPVGGGTILCAARNLLPITDPDADITEQHDEHLTV